jgi:hypothetical protein
VLILSLNEANILYLETNEAEAGGSEVQDEPGYTSQGQAALHVKTLSQQTDNKQKLKIPFLLKESVYETANLKHLLLLSHTAF